MRISAFSDIHIDINMKRKDLSFTDHLIKYLENLEGDLLLLAGDIAGNTQLLVTFLQKTSHLDFTHKIYVPGNHDVWVNQSSEDLSFVKYYEILPPLVEKYNWHYLPNNPLVIEDTAIVGTMGWYDYSSRNQIWDDKCDLQQYEKKIHPNGNVELMDRHYVKFGHDDITMAHRLNEDLLQDFDYVERRFQLDHIKQTIVLTHMVPFKEFIPYKGLFRYDFFTAYFGNLQLGELLRNKSKSHNIHAIFGQTHIPKIKRLNPKLKGYCVPLGYPREYGRNIDLTDLFEERIISIDL